jgi:predicted DNA-binding protein YlxM (UPF0122 family)
MMVGVSSMLEKMNQVNELYDIYKVLLTDKQRAYIELYYHEDLSLSEIADEMGVSRNAVHDNIRRTEKLLADYEEKLRIYEKDRKRSAICDKIKICTNDATVLELIWQLQALE